MRHVRYTFRSWVGALQGTTARSRSHRSHKRRQSPQPSRSPLAARASAPPLGPRASAPATVQVTIGDDAADDGKYAARRVDKISLPPPTFSPLRRAGGPFSCGPRYLMVFHSAWGGPLCCGTRSCICYVAVVPLPAWWSSRRMVEFRCAVLVPLCHYGPLYCVAVVLSAA